MSIAEELLISDPLELLHRNVHPDFIVNGRASSQAFRLRGSDDGHLSVQQNSKASASVAFQRYTAQKLVSGGVWSVLVRECLELDLKAYQDPTEFDDSHAVVDMSKVKDTRKRMESLADKLAAKAHNRGCQFKPEGSG
jgi:hypothetical protein